ncbi:MAG: hypothetical protein H6656_03925 [Ardenticatenaceae bacterium]|nr:hypothetical protein [Ardenticatenaceae bacterium]
MAMELGYLTIDEATLIDISDISSLPADKVVIMATGSQGEPSAVMGRLARGNHNRLQIEEGDTVVLSAHAIPGNEELGLPHHQPAIPARSQCAIRKHRRCARVWPRQPGRR